jgi:hypothetical protein
MVPPAKGRKLLWAYASAVFWAVVAADYVFRTIVVAVRAKKKGG